MTAEDAHHIEQYLLTPEVLAPDVRRSVEHLIEGDAAAQEWHRTLRVFYDALDETDGPAPAVDRFLDTLFSRSNVVALSAEAVPSSCAPTVMAADAASVQGGFETIAALRADEDDILIRVLRDRSTKEGRLYLIARGQEAWTHALVTFPEADLAVPIGASGRATVPELARVDPGALQQAALHRMLAEAQVDRQAVGGNDATAWSTLLASGHTLRLRSTGDGLAVQCALQDVDAPSPQYVAVEAASAAGADDVTVAPIESGSAHLHGLPDASPYTIRLYA